MVRGVAKGDIVRVKPALWKQGEDWQDRSMAAKNVGLFWKNVYAAAYGGTPTQLPNGSFHPDVSLETKNGTVETEVKSNSTRNSRPRCSVIQLEKYLESLSYNHFEWGQESPEVNYAFFQYGARDEKPSGLSNRELMSAMSRGGRRLIIAPISLVCAMLLDSPTDQMDHSSSQSPRDIENYWRIPGRLLSEVNENPNRTVRDLYARLKEREIDVDVGVLGLDRLRVSREEFPDNLRCWGYDIQPFPVTRFRVSGYRDWLPGFLESQDEIVDALHTDYAEKAGQMTFLTDKILKNLGKNGKANEGSDLPSF